jgi:hypothetical protein
MALFLSFLKIFLKGLKQFASKGCKTWEEWKGKMKFFIPNFYASFMAFNVTCEPCPSKTNRCQFG